jgi:glucan phosphoethanolaminetransferase (alkaline phosphatase superfamily)
MQLRLSAAAAMLSIPTLIDMAMGLTTPDPSDLLNVLFVILFLLAGAAGMVSICLSLASLREIKQHPRRTLVSLVLSFVPFIVFGLGFLPIWGFVHGP